MSINILESLRNNEHSEANIVSNIKKIIRDGGLDFINQYGVNANIIRKSTYDINKLSYPKYCLSKLGGTPYAPKGEAGEYFDSTISKNDFFVGQFLVNTRFDSISNEHIGSEINPSMLSFWIDTDFKTGHVILFENIKPYDDTYDVNSDNGIPVFSARDKILSNIPLGDKDINAYLSNVYNQRIYFKLNDYVLDDDRYIYKTPYEDDIIHLMRMNISLLEKIPCIDNRKKELLKYSNKYRKIYWTTTLSEIDAITRESRIGLINEIIFKPIPRYIE